MTFLPSSPVPVEGLGQTSDDAVWLGLPAVAQQRIQATRAGLPLGKGHDVVTVSDGAVASADLLARFRRASDRVAGDVVGVVGGPLAAMAEHAAFGPPTQLWRFRGGTPAESERAARLAAATRVEVAGEVRLIDVPVADRPGGRAVAVALGDAYACGLHHWSGVLWANLLGLGPELWRGLVGPAWVAPFRLGWAWLRARSTDPFVVAGKMTSVGRGARVHPSAVVEGSIVGPGAEIGPGAVVRGAIVGEGARVEAQALVLFGVLAPGAVVQRRGWMQLSVLGARAGFGGAMQLGVVGPEALVKDGSYLMDTALDVPATVLRAGERVEAPLGTIGVGVGARAIVGSGVWVAPGRSLAPGSRVVRAPEDVVRRPPEGG